jgi:hypothetical protein
MRMDSSALIIGALAVGQTIGKMILFESARHGTGRLLRRSRHKEPSERDRRWADRTRRWLASPRAGHPWLQRARCR